MSLHRARGGIRVHSFDQKETFPLMGLSMFLQTPTSIKVFLNTKIKQLHCLSLHSATREMGGWVQADHDRGVYAFLTVMYECYSSMSHVWVLQFYESCMNAAVLWVMYEYYSSMHICLHLVLSCFPFCHHSLWSNSIEHFPVCLLATCLVL